MICLVGSSPSSGSTYLADLLDASMYSACGPELELFANKFLYEFSQEFKDNPFKSSLLSTVKTRRIRLKEKTLKSYGFDKETIHELIKNSENYQEFEANFFKHVAAFRKKDKMEVLFEKTPQNVNAIGEFLDSSKGYFIYMVRNPIQVYNSIKKREFGNLTSASTWLVNVSCVHHYINHPRFLIVRYKDVVANPFKIAKELMEKVLGHPIESVEELEKNYKNNPYRCSIGRIKTWSNKGYGDALKKAGKEKVYVDPGLVAMKQMKVAKDYAALHDISELKFLEALKLMDYEEVFLEYLDQCSPIENQPKVIKHDRIDLYKMIAKGSYHALQRNIKLSEINTLLNPIEAIPKNE